MPIEPSLMGCYGLGVIRHAFCPKFVRTRRTPHSSSGEGRTARRKENICMSMEIRGRPGQTSLEEVDLSAIDISPQGPNCMSFGFDLEAMIRSIAHGGVLNPPLLNQAEEGRYHVVCGYKRILAVKALGQSRAYCRVLPRGSMDPLDALLLNLHENLATRAFNEVEKAMAFQRLSRLLEEARIVSEFMPLFGLPKRIETLALYRKLDEELSDRIKAALVRGNVSVKAVKSAFSLNPEDRALVLELLADLKLSINNQLQVIDLIIDISERDSVKVSGILEEEGVKRILSDSRRNGPQRAGALMRRLRGLRLPLVAEAEKIFRRKVAGLSLPEDVHVHAPPFFESGIYRLELAFRDGRSLRRRLRELAAIQGIEDLGDPWKPEQ